MASITLLMEGSLARVALLVEQHRSRHSTDDDLRTCPCACRGGDSDVGECQLASRRQARPSRPGLRRPAATHIVRAATGPGMTT